MSSEEVSDYTIENQFAHRIQQSRSFEFRSSDDDHDANEETEKTGLAGQTSSTNIIFINSDSSRLSLNGRRLLNHYPVKRKFICANFEASVKMKIFKDVEGRDDSYRNFCRLKSHLPLKRQEVDIFGKQTHDPKPKAKIWEVKNMRPDTDEVESDPSKYTNSIFKVFLKNQEKIIKKKLVVSEVPPKFSRRRTVSSKVVLNVAKKTTKGPSKESLVREEKAQQQGIVQVLSTTVKKLSSTSTELKPVSSKRSVHWEDEVTLIQRSNSSLTTESCENDPSKSDILEHYQHFEKINIVKLYNTDDLENSSSGLREESKLSLNSLDLQSQYGNYEEIEDALLQDKLKNKPEDQLVTKRNNCNKRRKSFTSDICSTGGNKSTSSSVDMQRLPKKSDTKVLRYRSSEELRSFGRRRDESEHTLLARRVSGPAVFCSQSSEPESQSGDFPEVFSFSSYSSEPQAHEEDREEKSGNDEKDFRCGESRNGKVSECLYEIVHLSSGYPGKTCGRKRTHNQSKSHSRGSVAVCGDKFAVDGQSPKITTESLKECLQSILKFKKIISHLYKATPEQWSIIEEIVPHLASAHEEVLAKKEKKNEESEQNSRPLRKPVGRSKAPNKILNQSSSSSNIKEEELNQICDKTMPSEVFPSKKTTLDREDKMLGNSIEVPVVSRPQKSSSNLQRSREKSGNYDKDEEKIKLRDHIREKICNRKKELSAKRKESILQKENVSCKETISKEDNDKETVKVFNNVNENLKIGESLKANEQTMHISDENQASVAEETSDVRKQSTSSNKKGSSCQDYSKNHDVKLPIVTEKLPNKMQLTSTSTDSVGTCIARVVGTAPTNNEEPKKSAPERSQSVEQDNSNSSGSFSQDNVKLPGAARRPYSAGLQPTARPPSRKPYFDRPDSESGMSSLPVIRVESTPVGRSRNTPIPARREESNAPTDIGDSKPPPQPRMYSTLREFGTRSPEIVKEQLKLAIATLNTPQRTPSRENVASSTPKSKKSLQSNVTSDEKAIEEPLQTESENSENNEVGNTPTNLSVNSPSTDHKISANNMGDKKHQSRNLKEKKSRIENIRNALGMLASPKPQDSRQNLSRRRTVIKERLPNYQPPWERVDLSPNRSQWKCQESGHVKQLSRVARSDSGSSDPLTKTGLPQVQPSPLEKFRQQVGVEG